MQSAHCCVPHRSVCMFPAMIWGGVNVFCVGWTQHHAQQRLVKDNVPNCAAPFLLQSSAKLSCTLDHHWCGIISFRGDLSAHTRERGKLASDKPVAGLQPNSYWYPRSNMLRGTHCTRFCVRRHAAYGGFNKFRQNFHSFLNEFQSNLRIMRNFLDPKIHLDECVIFH